MAEGRPERRTAPEGGLGRLRRFGNSRLGASCLLSLVVLACTAVVCRHELFARIPRILGSTPPAERGASRPVRPFLTCSEDVKQLQVTRFHTNRTHWTVNCAPHVWIDAYRDAAGPGHMILLDIGCNKGYFTAELFNSLIPELGVNKFSLWQAYGTFPPYSTSEDPVYRCSNACDSTYERCTEVSPAPPSAWLNRSVEIHCFDPSSVNIDRMLSARKALAHRFTGSSAWHIHKAPVTRQPGPVKWAKGCEGEVCSILSDDQQGNVEVLQATSVDSFLQATFPPAQRVAAVKVDAEGFDPEVIEGAAGALIKQRVDVLMFEYHHLNRWQEVTLASVVDKLEVQGLVCYFEAHGYLFKLSRACWDNSYEIRSWSNVVCGLKNSWVENVFDGSTWLRAAHPQQFITSVKGSAY